MSLLDYDSFAQTEVSADEYDRWRRRLLALLAAERVDFLWLLLGISEETLTQHTVFAAYTVKDLLAHIAAWDELYRQRLELLVEGNADSITSVDLHKRNVTLQAKHSRWSLNQALQALVMNRSDFMQTLARVDDESLHQPAPMPWADGLPVRTWAVWRAAHDATHAQDLRLWREEHEFERAAGPKRVLLAALNASRREMRALAGLVPESQRASQKVMGQWTLKDVLGHVCDWEAYCVDSLRAGEPQEMGYRGTEEWNAAHAAARREHPFEKVQNDFQDVRETLVSLLHGWRQGELAGPMENPWGPQQSRYGWFHAFLAHEREHALHLRQELLLSVD